MAATGDQETSRLLEALERHGAAPIQRIFDEVGLKITPATVRKLAQRAPVFLSDLKRPKAEVLALALASKPGRESSVVASDEQLVSLLQIRAANTKTRAHTPAKLRDMLPAAHRASFADALQKRVAGERWPRGVGALRAERTLLVFLTEHIQTHTLSPSAAPAATVAAREDPFEVVFERAFSELHDPRRSNLVELAQLRTRLSGYDRGQFDSGLRRLRESARYVLQTFDGRHGELSAELEQAAIQEGGRTFVYVARRVP